MTFDQLCRKLSGEEAAKHQQSECGQGVNGTTGIAHNYCGDSVDYLIHWKYDCTCGSVVWRSYVVCRHHAEQFCRTNRLQMPD